MLKVRRQPQRKSRSGKEEQKSKSRVWVQRERTGCYGVKRQQKVAGTKRWSSRRGRRRQLAP